MAGRNQITEISRVVLVALVVWLGPSLGMVRDELLCNNVKGSCHHNQSSVCGYKQDIVSCDHQLKNQEVMSHENLPRCRANRFERASDCGHLRPSRVYDGDKPLVEMQLYHYWTWFAKRSTINFTFPYPEWNLLQLQYSLNSTGEIMCRQFRLLDVSLPLNDTLVFDCPVLNTPEDSVWRGEVTVVNDRGYGGTYTFILPSQSDISPGSTLLKDWHVFFYLHRDYTSTSHLPVTVQTYSHQVSYRVSIVKCLDPESLECGHYSVLNSTLVEHPKEEIWTVHLPVWSNPGYYAVTVQIVSDQCPADTGCRVSISPRFEIESSMLGIWITIGMAFFLISILTFLLIFNNRLQTNKRILKASKEAPPSVLLVYLPETDHHLQFISKFAAFLRNSCHLHPYLVDQDVGTQDPNCWTRDHIIKAEKVLLIVPSRPQMESCTPIRNQWIVALNYLSGHHFTIQQVTRKVAVVMLPSSGSIPREVSHTSFFKLVGDIGPLVTWLHNGTQLDEVFLWRPHIKSSNDRNAHRWSDVRDAAIRTTSVSASSVNCIISASYKDSLITNKDCQGIPVNNNESIHSEDLVPSECASLQSESVFDPNIPSLDKLQEKINGSNSSWSDQMLGDGSDNEDDGIFT